MSETQPTTVAQQPATNVVPFPERDLFELALRKSKVYASSTLVPMQYQDSIPNCLIALNMAKRIGADELMVMQNLHVVNGKPGWSGQFLIATFNQCGRFTSMRFEWQGVQSTKDWGCRAYATERATGEKIVGAWVNWKMVDGEGWAAKKGSKWLTMPEQMFLYRAAAFLVRAYAPEIAMGLQTVEELRDIVDATPETPATTSGNVVESINAEITGSAETGTAQSVQENGDAMRAAMMRRSGDVQTETVQDGAVAAASAELAGGGQTIPQTRPEIQANPVTFAEIMAQALMAEKSKNQDLLMVAEDLARSVKDPQQRAELDVELRRVRKALEAK